MAEQEILEESIPQDAPEDEAAAALPSPDDFEDEEDYRLTLKQKILVGVAWFVSTIVFSILFFPRDLMLRAVLAKAVPQVKVDFSAAKPGLFSQEFQSLRVGLPDGTNFASDDLQSDLSVFSLMNGNASGTLNLVNADYGSNTMGLNARSAAVKLNLTGMSDGITAMRGDLQIQGSDLGIEKLPPSMASYVQVEPSKIKIRSLQLPLAFSDTGLSIQDGRVVSNLFNLKIRVAGTYRGQVLDTMQLDGSICIKPDEKLEADFPDVFGIYVFAGGAAGGDLCFEVKGTLGQPQFAKK